MEELTPEQREQLEDARRQMEEFEAQKDQLPEAARGMVERQMERMRRQMDMLTGGSGFEMVTDVIRIDINQGRPPPPKPEG